MRVFAATAGRCRLLLTHAEAGADLCVPELVKSVESGKKIKQEIPSAKLNFSEPFAMSCRISVSAHPHTILRESSNTEHCLSGALFCFTEYFSFSLKKTDIGHDQKN